MDLITIGAAIAIVALLAVLILMGIRRGALDEDESTTHFFNHDKHYVPDRPFDWEGPEVQ